MTPIEFRELAKLPAMEVPFQTIESKYRAQIAALMVSLHDSKAGKAKDLKPKEFKWQLVYKRAEDPPHVTDPQAFTQILAANSQSWLKCTGKGWIGYEPLNVTPDKIRVIYEQRAQLICADRLEEQNKPDEAAREEAAPEQPAGDLMQFFDRWCKIAKPNQNLESAARAVLVQLIQSAGD